MHSWLLVHLCESLLLPCASVTDLDVQLQRNGSDVGVEVERSSGAAAQPVGHVFGIGQR